MRKEWGVTLTTTVEAVNSLKRKKILNIYSVTIRNELLGNYFLSNLCDIVATKICDMVKIVLPRVIGGVIRLLMVSQ